MDFDKKDQACFGKLILMGVDPNTNPDLVNLKRGQKGTVDSGRTCALFLSAFIYSE